MTMFEHRTMEMWQSGHVDITLLGTGSSAWKTQTKKGTHRHRKDNGRMVHLLDSFSGFICMCTDEQKYMDHRLAKEQLIRNSDA